MTGIHRYVGILVVLLLILSDSVSYVHATTDAVAPAVKKDAWLVATKFPLPPAAGQIVLVKEGAQTRLYRVVKVELTKGQLVLARNGEMERVARIDQVSGTVVLTVP